MVHEVDPCRSLETSAIEIDGFDSGKGLAVVADYWEVAPARGRSDDPFLSDRPQFKGGRSSGESLTVVQSWWFAPPAVTPNDSLIYRRHRLSPGVDVDSAQHRVQAGPDLLSPAQSGPARSNRGKG